MEQSTLHQFVTDLIKLFLKSKSIPYDRIEAMVNRVPINLTPKQFISLIQIMRSKDIDEQTADAAIELVQRDKPEHSEVSL